MSLRKETSGESRLATARSLSVWYLIVPLLTAGFLLPGAVGLADGALQRHQLDFAVALILAPALLALIAAPGYFYVFLTHGGWAGAGRAVRRWSLLSLVLAAVASGASAVASIPTGLGPILSLWSLVMSVKLLSRFRAGV